ncbi:2-oxoglutarate and iron-dependent oxygenase domain-containing protein [Pararoseomonas sp. SCSIO 73927]|uniref:2-oxoglutarate and iron-dependent oxygenase domain-containing protein n=1 Tax=Pararoseomonas sp. SCSIO 73927 TaxID=3114537 RepID=UPI0030D24F85
MESVPIIDVSGLRGDLEVRQAVADRIGRACEEIGFFCVTRHSIPQDLIRRVREPFFVFFGREESEKRAIERQPPSYRGYLPLASEGLAASGAPERPRI